MRPGEAGEKAETSFRRKTVDHLHRVLHLERHVTKLAGPPSNSRRGVNKRLWPAGQQAKATTLAQRALLKHDIRERSGLALTKDKHTLAYHH